jgi:hypothetical protein
MGQTALLPLRRRACCRFLSPLKIHRLRAGLNPRTLGPIASTLPTTTEDDLANHFYEFSSVLWTRYIYLGYYFMQYGLSWEANSSSSGQDICHHLWDKKISYGFTRACDWTLLR